MSRRKLRPDEIDLWTTVARSTDPLHPEKTKPLARSLPLKPDVAKKEVQPPAIEPFSIGSKAKRTPRNSLAPSITDAVSSAPVNMDFKTYKHMRRGKLAPEGRIDLHGLTTQDAHPTLSRFILSSHARGLRLVLVITGKGRAGADDGPIPTRVGILRHEVPRWLRQQPIAACVQQVTPANQRHGGTGAYYVYLRRR